jgi:hypothetical protein
MTASDELYAVLDSQPTGVIVGVAAGTLPADANAVRAMLEERFPGVRFAIVIGCTGVTSFTYDDSGTEQ